MCFVEASYWPRVALVPLLAPLFTAGPLAAQDHAALFAASASGVDSPAGVELRRHWAAAVPFLVGVLEKDSDPVRRLLAIDHLQRIGAPAAPAVPALLDCLQADDRECTAGVVALGALAPFVGEQARAKIAAALLAVDRDRQQMQGIHFQVGRAWSRTLAPPTRDLKELARLLRSDNPFLVELGCQFACELGTEARPLLPVVAELVRRDRFSVSTVTSPTAPGVAIPAMTDWRPQVRAALFALVQAADPGDPVGAPLVAERLPKARPDEQVRLLQMLGRMGPAAHAQVHFVATLTGAVLPVAREAATTLGMIGRGVDEARRTLAALCTSADAQLAARARAALRQLDREPPER
jgi:hypothetical protein